MEEEEEILIDRNKGTLTLGGVSNSIHHPSIPCSQVWNFLIWLVKVGSFLLF